MTGNTRCGARPSASTGSSGQPRATGCPGLEPTTGPAAAQAGPRRPLPVATRPAAHRLSFRGPSQPPPPLKPVLPLPPPHRPAPLPSVSLSSTQVARGGPVTSSFSSFDAYPHISFLASKSVSGPLEPKACTEPAFSRWLDQQVTNRRTKQRD